MNEGLTELITWTTSREARSLNGPWKAIIDVYDIGLAGPFGDPDTFNPKRSFAADQGRHTPGRRVEYDFDTSPEIEVPGDWNTQVDQYHFYEGSMWFRRRFEQPERDGDRRSVLYVGAANHETLVFLNGAQLARHVGGYGPFCVELTDHLRYGDDNSLVFRVNNRRTTDGVPTTRTDWFNYGGITRDVLLLDLPTTFVRDAVVQLDPNDPDTITAEVWLDGDEAEQELEILVGERPVGSLRAGADGHATGTFTAPSGLALWSPSSPTLHDVTVRCETDEVADRIGFRTIGTDGSTILLNGEPIFLAGISIHDEAIGEPARRMRNPAEARSVLAHAKDLNANFVRLAHYQHNEHTVRACDELGLLSWCEIPVYWGIDFANTSTYENAAEQVTELVTRDRNRASVALWSVANETFPGDERNRFLAGLANHVRELDTTRLVTAALFARQDSGDHVAALRGEGDQRWVVDDPLGEHLDVLGVNQYHGWYYGTFDAMAELTWSSPYDKPLIMSEFGAGAKTGLRGADDEPWTEDFQAEVYRQQFGMLARIPFLAGTSPWILKDFRAPFRVLPEIQDGFNRKGVIGPNGERKLAFDIVAEWNAERRAQIG